MDSWQNIENACCTTTETRVVKESAADVAQPTQTVRIIGETFVQNESVSERLQRASRSPRASGEANRLRRRCGDDAREKAKAHSERSKDYCDWRQSECLFLLQHCPIHYLCCRSYIRSRVIRRSFGAMRPIRKYFWPPREFASQEFSNPQFTNFSTRQEMPHLGNPFFHDTSRKLHIIGTFIPIILVSSSGTMILTQAPFLADAVGVGAHF